MMTLISSRLVVSLAVFILLMPGCAIDPARPQPPTYFESTATLNNVSPWINEASGIADSKANNGMLWVHEDSGTPAQLYLLGKDGNVSRKVFFKAGTNRDWEDIALANGPVAGKNYLYLADIGDNAAAYPFVSFYRFEEPSSLTDTIRIADKIDFKYSDGPRDAEAFFVDNTTNDIYIITKRETKSRLYKLSYPYSTSSLNTANFILELPYTLVVSAAMSSNGNELIVKTYNELYYYRKTVILPIQQWLQYYDSQLAYQPEPQGEAICFANDNSGFYCLSENPGLVTQSLQFYKRK